MSGIKSLIVLMAATFAHSSCVTSGPGSEGAAIAGVVVVFSHLASSAQSGDLSAKKAWCSSFRLVHAAVQAEEESGQPPDDEVLTEKLLPEMHSIMRSNGYQLHRQQISIVIRDALNVSRNQQALKETTESCHVLLGP
jgi:hypothetical protein